MVIRALGTADLETGFVYGMDINFDGSLDADAVEADAASCGDYTAAAPFRRYARLWLRPDYTQAVADSAARVAKRIRSGLTLEEDILKTCQEAEIRGDVESPEMLGAHQRFPATGMQVHAEYTMYAHFYYLHGLQRLPAGEHRQAAERLPGLPQLLSGWSRRHDARHAPGPDQCANQPVRTPRPMEKAPSDGWGPWKGRFRPPRFNKLSERLDPGAPFYLGLQPVTRLCRLCHPFRLQGATCSPLHPATANRSWHKCRAWPACPRCRGCAWSAGRCGRAG